MSLVNISKFSTVPVSGPGRVMAKLGSHMYVCMYVRTYVMDSNYISVKYKMLLNTI